MCAYAFCCRNSNMPTESDTTGAEAEAGTGRDTVSAATAAAGTGVS